MCELQCNYINTAAVKPLHSSGRASYIYSKLEPITYIATYLAILQSSTMERLLSGRNSIVSLQSLSLFSQENQEVVNELAEKLQTDGTKVAN